MEAVGFQRRCCFAHWIRYHSIAAVTFFIPYSLGKMAATPFQVLSLVCRLLTL
jgi:hypothetical protein